MKNLREHLRVIIFGADTPAGKTFDIVLLVFIVASVLMVLLESVPSVNARYENWFVCLEWFFTILFTIEYLLRLWIVRRPLRYARSFYGVIDLLAILPTYLHIFFVGTKYFTVIRALRLLRVFRILKLGQFMKEGNVILGALKASRAKITVFLFFILVLVTIVGSVMYVIEGGSGNPGFQSIPQSIYWAIVTLTTVGYGDITPTSDLGRFLAAVVMILGYAVIAVPTGIVSSELVHANHQSTRSCNNCEREGLSMDARYCKYCGEVLKKT